MTKAEFIAKAKECGYASEDITEMIALIEGANNEGVQMKYEDLALLPQPKY